MSSSSCNRRSESGAQLLARLSTRPDVTDVDPFIFGKITPSTSQLVELYGTEGVGKTELALQCAARVCLPESKNGIALSGLQAKVVYMDTELKFSILRLAVILEKQILKIMKSKSTHRSGGKESEGYHSVQDDNVEMKSENVDQNHVIPTKVLDGKDSSFTHAERRLLGHKRETDTIQERGEETREPPQGVVLSPHEIEEIVQESLGRVQVVRPLDSQQLLASLISLEPNLSEDPCYALLIIDSISAFYWLDRFASPTSYQHLDSRMAPIAKMLKRYSSELGIPCLMTKSAYFGGKNSSDQDHSATVSCNSSSDIEKVKNSELYAYNEYFGKSWSSVNAKKIIMNSVIDEVISHETNRDKVNEVVKRVLAFCVSSENIKQYVFKEDLLVPI